MMQTRDIHRSGVGNCVRSGAIAGALSALAFAIIHHIFISDIWFSLIMMMVAGALCGLCIGWSYALLTKAPTIGNWWRYNMLYVGLLALLGITSVLVFEPTTTMAALVEANAPPDKLIGQALPLTVLFTLLAAVLISLLYRGNWRHFGIVLLTCTILVLLLGLNVSVLGFVFIPRGSLYLVMEFFGLILAINVVYAALFTVLERKQLSGSDTIPRQQQPDESKSDMSQDFTAQGLGNLFRSFFQDMPAGGSLSRTGINAGNQFMICGVTEKVLEQVKATEAYEIIGGESIFPTSPIIGDSLEEAWTAAEKWVAEQGELESDSAEGASEPIQ